MTIQYCSDLHLEFPDNVRFLELNPIKPVGDILVMAGDIVPFKQLKNHGAFFDFLSGAFEAVYWLPGNHEYYGGNILNRSGSFRETIRSNVFLVNNEVAVHNELKLVLSTLWSHIGPLAEWDISRGMADYKVIRMGDDRFRPIHSNRLHREALKFIKAAVAGATTKNIFVATHHVPTFLNYPPLYLGSDLNEAFATELSDYIESSGIDYWLFGHHHFNAGSFTIGNTKMITNQLGYVKYGEHSGFRNDAVIRI